MKYYTFTYLGALPKQTADGIETQQSTGIDAIVPLILEGSYGQGGFSRAFLWPDGFIISAVKAHATKGNISSVFAEMDQMVNMMFRANMLPLGHIDLSGSPTEHVLNVDEHHNIFVRMSPCTCPESWHLPFEVTSKPSHRLDASTLHIFHQATA